MSWKANKKIKSHIVTAISMFKCVLGYYCPTGSSQATEVICPIGFHCPLGSATMMECVAGTHTDATGQSTCATCPESMFNKRLSIYKKHQLVVH